MMLREFLYVDTQKVRSLLAQLGEGGIEEEVKITEKTQTKLSIGAKNIAARDKDVGAEASTTKSLADAVFPSLEDAMETAGYLVDLSGDLQDPTFWRGALQEKYPEGSFVRVTGPARLFDSRYITRIFAGISQSAVGFSGLTGTGLAHAGPKNPKQRGGNPRPNPTPGSETPEAEIEDFPSALFDDAITATQLRGFAKLTRSLFSSGLHLIMNPTDEEGLTVSVRLEEGRSFLESATDVLFARYGVHEQQWTVVGTIGSHSVADDEEAKGTSPFEVRARGLDRGALTGMINSFVSVTARHGFADLPQYPGFSIVPFAVYRSILRSSGELLPRGAVV